ncbi:MAG: hypothetical protein Q8M83_02215 [bacterium]|nr:hypothetical protein [bacterium]
MEKLIKIHLPQLPTTSISAARMEEGEIICRIDDDLAYEKRNWPYLVVLPIAWLMTIWAMSKTLFCNLLLSHQPKATSILFDRFSRPLHDIRLGAASWKALDIICHWFEPSWREECYQNLGWLERLLADFWIGMKNAQAVRNRRRMAAREIHKAVESFLPAEEVRIFSIAAGSGEVVIEEIARRKKDGVRIIALLLDNDPTACVYAKSLAERYDVTDQLTIIQENVRHIEVVLEERKFRPHIIEMLGFLDYRPWQKATVLIQRIFKLLPQKGVFLTCHIRRNCERYFLRWVISWWMLYRQPEELASLIHEGGFAPENIILMYEPHTIHGIAVAKKNS